MKRALLLTAFIIPGCAPGPKSPVPLVVLPPPVPSSQITASSGPSQTIVAGATVQADWWRLFDNGQLDAIVARALSANSDIATADAALRQAREQAAVTAGGNLPQIAANYQAQRLKTSRTLSNPLVDPNQYLYTLHTAQLSIAYSLDLFGGQRAKMMSAHAAAEVALDRFAAARTTVVANVVTAIIQHASLDAQIEEARASIRSNGAVLSMMQKREVLGDIGAADVAAQQTALATAEANLPQLTRQCDHQRSLIATLIGVAAGSSLPDLPSLNSLKLPSTLPVAIPAEIVANRPDVRAAEAQLRGAAADVGTAIAARFPSIQLSANVGGESTAFASMFASGNPFWALIGGITQPLFNGGVLRHQQHVAEAALDGAEAQYRAVILQAFTDVSDALSGLRTDADAFDAATRASDAADQTLLFARRQLALGGAGTLTVLNAEAADSQANAQRVQTQAARLTDTVALYQAVGGGVQQSR